MTTQEEGGGSETERKNVLEYVSNVEERGQPSKLTQKTGAPFAGERSQRKPTETTWPQPDTLAW